MKRLKRLQGEEWHKIKNELRLVKTFKNEKNHVKGIYKDNLGNKYSHWLNNDEIKDLIGKRGVNDEI